MWRAGLLLLVVGASVACAPQPRAQFGSGLAQVPATPEVASRERAMFRLLNRDRQGEGLAPLAYDERLADVARSQSADMRDHHFFEHVSPTTGSPDDRLNAAGYLFLAARENLSEAPDIELSQKGLMESPHHHENIMATDITHVGIGIVDGGVRDPRNLTVTQLFASPSKVETPDQAHVSILASLKRERSGLKLGPIPESKLLRELAELHVSGLTVANLDADLAAAGTKVSEAVSSAQTKGMRAVLVGAQLLPDSTRFAAPAAALENTATSVGVAVRSVTNESGRPVLLVLLVVGVR